MVSLIPERAAEVWRLDRAARSALAPLLSDATPLHVREWLSLPAEARAKADAALGGEGAESLAAAASVLSRASDALVITGIEPFEGQTWASTTVHDGRLAVRVSGDRDGVGVISAPLPLADVIRVLARDVRSEATDGVEADTMIMGAGTLRLLQITFPGRRSVTCDELATRLLNSGFVHVDPALAAERLVAGGLATLDGGTLTIAGGVALDAIASGSTMRVEAVSLSHEAPGAYDERHVEFIGSRGNRLHVANIQQNPDLVAIARRPFDDIHAALWSLVTARREPAMMPAPDDGDPTDPLDTLARDRPLGFAGADLLELSDTPLSRALLAPPATVAIVRGAWSRSHADGVAVWPAGALAWCWRAGAGSAKACGRDELPSLVGAAVAEHLAMPELGALEVLAANKDQDGLAIGHCRLVANGDGWRHDGDSQLGDIPIAPEPIAEALLAAAGLASADHPCSG